MSATTAIAPGPGFSRPHLAIMWGGLAAGVIDLAFAFVFYGTKSGAKPFTILQSIAGGLIGIDAAHAGELATAVLGGTLHFAIAIAMAAVFTLASLKLKSLVRMPVICGLLYGLALYFVMNAAVLPLSAYHSHFLGAQTDATLLPLLGTKLRADWIAILDHMAGVGLPIALAARRWTRH